uniref:Uncharacterized protein n=1 Tax=Vespula pensylvanica TaxID=30213 RepID=A0A834UGF8_VESPE|nr:hypothetical protein H0235_001072 [Vespula pensylvanica]
MIKSLQIHQNHIVLQSYITSTKEEANFESKEHIAVRFDNVNGKIDLNYKTKPDTNLKLQALETKDPIDLSEGRTQSMFQNISNLQNVAKSFISYIRSNIPTVGVEEIYNADQRGP